jgi:hypothetical protein
LISRKFEKAINNNDAAAVGELFAKDWKILMLTVNVTRARTK